MDYGKFMNISSLSRRNILNQSLMQIVNNSHLSFKILFTNEAVKQIIYIWFIEL